MRLALVAGLLMLIAGASAVPSLAKSTTTMRFQPGDVFFTDPNGVQEYSPTGELRQTIPDTTGAGALCFSPSGNRLVLPGVGLFNKAGQLVPSSWASAPDGRCAVDTAGNVYVRSGFTQITKYNLNGRRAQTFQVAPYNGIGPYYLALAPDQCTVYYGAFNAINTGRFDACTDTQESPLTLTPGLLDDLQIRPNGQIVMTGDYVAWLYDLTGGVRQTYNVPTDELPSGEFRSVSLDPDGTSFWDCCDAVGPSGTAEIFRFDIATGQILTAWRSPILILGGMAVYAPQRLS